MRSLGRLVGRHGRPITITLPDGSTRDARRRAPPRPTSPTSIGSRPGQGGGDRRGRRRRARPRPAARRRRRGRDRHRRHRRGPPRPAPLDGARAGPGRDSTCSPAPSSRIGPADRGRLLLRLRAARRRARSRDDDLERIEARMREIVKADQPFVRDELDADDGAGAVRRPAVQAARSSSGSTRPTPTTPTPARSARRHDQRLPQHRRSSSTCAAARTCRAPGRLGHFKLHEGRRRVLAGRREAARCCSASTARRGSRSRRSSEHLHRLEEAEKRDHRKLGAELDLFSFPDEIGGGLAVWHPKGGHRPQADGGLQPRRATSAAATSSSTRRTSPRSTLFETSGHLDWYADGMYPPMEMDNGDVLPEADELPDAHA